MTRTADRRVLLPGGPGDPGAKDAIGACGDRVGIGKRAQERLIEALKLGTITVLDVSAIAR